MVIGVPLGCFTATALGQGTTVSILGTVYDESRVVLPGATVTATNLGTEQRRVTVTDDRGRYQMEQMAVGRHRIEAELLGFQTTTREVTLTLEGDAVNNFTLRVGAVSTEVMVTADSPLVDTSGSSLRNLVDQHQISDLPLNGRSFTDLATLQSGVTKDYLANTNNIGLEGGQLMISGSRSRQSLFQLDGTDLRNHRGAVPGSLAGVQLGVDTLQEFSVITSGTSQGGREWTSYFPVLTSTIGHVLAEIHRSTPETRRFRHGAFVAPCAAESQTEISEAAIHN